MEKIRFKVGYDYVLVGDYSVALPFAPAAFIYTDFIRFDTDGVLYIRNGYAWDGPSGPTIDTPDFMRGSLVHDALYQLLREDHLPREFRDQADDVLVQICEEDGMPGFRRAYVRMGVKIGGGPAAFTPTQILEAP